MRIQASQVFIRTATVKDCGGIQQIHRNCEDPWADGIECAAWITRRLERGFYIQVAQCGDKLVGHGEWVVSDEPKGRILYLGLLQIDEEYQRMGIGRAMLEDGKAYAKANGCSAIATIPETDNHSHIFYEKCGYQKGKIIFSCVLPTTGQRKSDSNRIPLESIPFTVIQEYPFIFGLAQPSSRHMWECCNRKPVTDDRIAISARLGDGSFVQFSYYNRAEALVLFWSKSGDLKNQIEEIISLGRECALESLRFMFYNDYASLFDRASVLEENREMVLTITG